MATSVWVFQSLSGMRQRVYPCSWRSAAELGRTGQTLYSLSDFEGSQRMKRAIAGVMHSNTSSASAILNGLGSNLADRIKTCIMLTLPNILVYGCWQCVDRLPIPSSIAIHPPAKRVSVSPSRRLAYLQLTVNRGGLNRSMQHWLAVYSPEFQSPRFFAGVD